MLPVTLSLTLMTKTVEPPRGKTNNVNSEQVHHTNRTVQAQKTARSLKFRI